MGWPRARCGMFPECVVLEKPRRSPLTLVGNALPRISRTTTRAVAFLTPPPPNDPVMSRKRRNEALPMEQKTKKARRHYNQKVKQGALQKRIPQLRRKCNPLEFCSTSAPTEREGGKGKTDLTHSGLDRDNAVRI